jgi:AraC-like DNA-binding protein
METYINPAVTPRFDLDTPFEPVIYARLFLEVLGEEGIEPGKLLNGTGLSIADLADPTNQITVAEQIQIYANAAEVSKRPAVGLLNGQRIMPHHHGVWGYAMQTAANLGQSITIFNQYFDVVGPIARQILQIDGKLARWISVDVLPTEPARRVGIEEMLSGNLNLCKILTDRKFRLKELWLDYPAPPGHEAYEELFQCPVLFSQQSIEMRFDASLLNLKLRSADPESERICEERCQELLDRLGRGADIVDRVRRIIYENPCDRRDEDTVASTLSMSARTLRRHLKAAQTSYRKVLNEVQEALAIDYLRRTDISVDEIAYLLGYSDTSNFRHAFKQWTGKTPSSYRSGNGAATDA